MKILIVLMSILISGCGASKHVIDRAEELCKPNGGLDVLYIVPTEAWCNNGARFKEKSFGKN